MAIAIPLCTDLKNYVDCTGAPIANGAALVTCASLPTQLCTALAGLTANGAATPATLLVGADCKTYTLPAAAATTNTATLNGSNLTTTVNGVPATVDLAPAVCATLAAKAAATAATQATAATVFIGADCLPYTLPSTPVDLNVTNFAVVNGNLQLTDQDGSIFNIPLSSLVPAYVDCNGTPISVATPLATCTIVDSKIQTALQTTAKDCNGAVVDLTTQAIATCANLTDPTILCSTLKLLPFDTTAATATSEILLLTGGASNTCHRANIATMFDAAGLKDCAGAAITTATPLATCTDITALQNLITALTNRVTILEQKLANTDTLTDCAGTVLATYVKG